MSHALSKVSFSSYRLSPDVYASCVGVKGFQGVATITMIAVGVGLAPMIQALHEVLNNPQDNTKVCHVSIRKPLLRWRNNND